MAGNLKTNCQQLSTRLTRYVRAGRRSEAKHGTVTRKYPEAGAELRHGAG
jgi:hypothetical protein